MTISVLIPAYNCESTIQATLDSVLRQTVQPDEILMMDDGSTDGTVALLDSFRPRVAVFRQPNKGLSGARNELLARTRSDLVAFLDSDDLWHPKYLETQLRIFARYPNAAGSFTGHVTFSTDSFCDWVTVSSTEVLNPLTFLRRYAAAPGPFGMSWLCVPKRVLEHMGSEPFQLKIAEDVCFCNSLALEGPIVYCSMPLSGYRMREGSLSSNRLALNEGEVRAFELIEKRYAHKSPAGLSKAFRNAFASKRRLFAKTLMGAGKTPEAHSQLRCSLRNSVNPLSLAKSFALLCLTCVPAALQPKWPSSNRDSRNSGSLLSKA